MSQVQKLRLHKYVLLYLQSLGSSLPWWSLAMRLTVPYTVCMDEDNCCVLQSVKQQSNLS